MPKGIFCLLVAASFKARDTKIEKKKCRQIKFVSFLETRKVVLKIASMARQLW